MVSSQAGRGSRVTTLGASTTLRSVAGRETPSASCELATLQGPGFQAHFIAAL